VPEHDPHNHKNARLVYTTGIGRRETCERCGVPVEECRCAQQRVTSEKRDGVVRITLDRRHRRGKVVTVVSGAPGDAAELAQQCRDLKKLLATGGTVNDGRLEFQGAHAERVAAYFAARGVKTKRVGG
jgi:translation initiation factor 1